MNILKWFFKEEVKLNIKEETDKLYDQLSKEVMPLYKALPPYMAYEKGFGYQGVLLTNIKTGKLQCHLCGEWWNNLANHVLKHGLSALEYKSKVGLFRKTPLRSLRLSKVASKNIAQFNKENPEKIAKIRKKSLKNILEARKSKPKSKRPIAIRNLHGTCDAQLKYRFDQLVKELGRVPVCNEVPFRQGILLRFGRYNTALKLWGYHVRPKGFAEGHKINTK